MIADDTILLPGIIADGVCQEAAVALDSDTPLEYSDRLADRADVVYGANARFRKMIQGNGNKPRDMLYAFMRHWLAAFLNTDHPDLFRRLPVGFASGREPSL